MTNIPSGGVVLAWEKLCMCWGRKWEISVPSAQFCCESKSILKNIFLKSTKSKKYEWHFTYIKLVKVCTTVLLISVNYSSLTKNFFCLLFLELQWDVYKFILLSCRNLHNNGSSDSGFRPPASGKLPCSQGPIITSVLFF